MGVKDVNLRESHPSEELPAMSSQSLSAKNFEKSIKCADGSEDCKTSVLSVHSFCHQKDSSRNPIFSHYSSQVSGQYVIETVSVENGDESSFEPEYDAGKQRDVKAGSNDLPAQSLLKSKIAPEEEENQEKETGKITLSSYYLKKSRISTKGILRLYLCFTLVIRVVDAGGTNLGVVFPPFMELIGQVDPSSQSTWLRGTTTIQRNRVNDGIMSNHSLWISDQQIENYDLEIRLPNRSSGLQQFPVKVMYSCDLVLDDEDLNAFNEGKKAVEVELSGEANVTKNYLLLMRNQTLQICYERGTERQLQPGHVQCNAAFKDIDPEKSSVNSPDKKTVKEESSGIGKYVGIWFGVGVVIAVICFVFMCLVKLQRRRKERMGNEAAAERALVLVHQISIESIESEREENLIVTYAV